MIKFSKRPISVPINAARASTICIAILLFVMTFHGGIQKRYDQSIPINNLSRVVNAIASYLTEIVYGEGGYVIEPSIVDKLEALGLSNNSTIVTRLGSKVPDNLTSAVFIDHILDEMWKDIPNYPPKTKLVGFNLDDVGLVTFTKLAFTCFGKHIRAYYYLFFLIFGLTLLVAFAERRNDIRSQIIMLSFMLLFYLFCFYSSQVDGPHGLTTVWSPHFITQLGFLPSIHILLMMTDRTGFTPTRALAVAFQSLVIALLLHIRSTAVYLPISIGASGLCYGLAEWNTLRIQGSRSSFPSIAKHSWPAIISLPLLVVFFQFAFSARSHVYELGGSAGHHTYWHSIYYSLQMHPDFQKQFGAMHENLDGDAMPIGGAHHYLKEHPTLNIPSIYTQEGGLKAQDMERLVRLAFFEFIRKYPRFVLETFLLYKAPFMFGYITDNFRSEWDHTSAVQKIVAALIVLLAAYFLSRDEENMRRYQRFTYCACTIASTAFAMIFLTVPGVIDPETILAAQFAVLLLLVLGLSHAYRRVTRLSMKAGTTTASLNFESRQ